MAEESKESRSQARLAAAAERKALAEAAAKKARRSRVFVSLAVIAPILLVVIVGVSISLVKSKVDSTVTAPLTASKMDGYGLLFNGTATPQIDVWEDFQCPACKNFEDANGAQVRELVQNGKARVVFHSLSFLGAESVILANAGACAADQNKFLELHDYLFKNQKPENSAYWGLSRVTAAGVAAGLNENSFKSCVKSGKFAKWVETIGADGAKNNINQTPTVLINGKEIDRNAGAYIDAVLFKKALADAGVK
ncbi:MAG: thioredoxin domain-containing protein [Actinomycetes bacterium]